jgi:hypothetical protein
VIVFCVTCKNRAQHLKQTLPQNLAHNPRSRFVVLDYNTQDDLIEYLAAYHQADINDGRLVVYTHFDEPVFRMAHAKNMAHRCGILEGGDILVNVDADNMTGPGMESWIAENIAPGAFLFGNMVKGQMTRGISGRIAVSDRAFLKVGGYDEEKFNGWGSDDKDFVIRLKMAGYEGVAIADRHLLAIPHNDKIRFKEYPHLANKDDSFFAVNKGTVGRAVVNDGAFGCGVVYRNFDLDHPIRLGPLPTRIFGIGMHKTGTTSLHHAFEMLGYDSWHWSSAHAAKAIWQEMNSKGVSPTVDRYQALCDLPIPMLYRQLDAAYPGSKFILTIRREEEWLQSVRRHFDPRFNKWQPGWDSDPFTHRVHSLLYGRRDFDTHAMRDRFRRHNAEVIDYFADRPHDLFVMNMDKGGHWDGLCRFLGLPVPEEAYPRMNGGVG